MSLALALYRELPVRQAAVLLRCRDKQLWRRIEFYGDQARALDSSVSLAGRPRLPIRLLASLLAQQGRQRLGTEKGLPFARASDRSSRYS